MKTFFARLFNIFTVLATLFLAWAVFNLNPLNPNAMREFLTEALPITYGIILGLNYLVLGKLTLWNSASA